MKRNSSFHSSLRFAQTSLGRLISYISLSSLSMLLCLMISGLTIQDLNAQSPGTVTVDLVSSNAARIVWTVDDGCDDYRLRWGIVGTHTPEVSEAGTVDRNDDIGCENGVTAKVIGPLLPETTYWVQVSRDVDSCNLICEGGPYTVGGPFEPAGTSLQFTTIPICEISDITVLNTLDLECNSDFLGEVDGRVTFNEALSKIEMSFTNNPPWTNFQNPSDPFDFTGTGLDVGYHSIYVRKGNNSCLHFVDFEIYSLDTIAPDLFCPNDTIVTSDDNFCDYFINSQIFDFIGFDNCPGDVRVFYQIDSLAPVESFSLQGVALPIGFHTIKWIAFDVAENLIDCTFNVEVIDDEVPMALCQDTLTFAIQAGDTITLEANQLDNGSTDNCTIFENLEFFWDSMSTQTLRSFTISDAGAPFNVSLWVNDETANKSECTTVLQFISGNPPVVVCNDITINLDFEGNYSFTAADISDITLGTTDDEGIASISFSQIMFDCSDINALPVDVTVTYTDNSNNESQCVTQVTVIDQTAPIFDCPEDVTIATGSECCFFVNDFTDLVNLSDNCIVDITVTQNPAFGAQICSTMADITITADDGNGNLTSCIVTMSAVDLVPPDITCTITDLTVSVSEDCVKTIPDLQSYILVEDNCTDFILFSQDPPIDATFAAEESLIHDVTIYMSDSSGNVSSCIIQVVGVIDSLPPFVCPIDLTLSIDDDCQITVPDFSTDLTSCQAMFATITQIPSAGSKICTSSGAVWQVTLTYDDGNTTTVDCTIELTAVDNTAPELNCPDDHIVSLDENCNLVIPDFTTEHLVLTGVLDSGYQFLGSWNGHGYYLSPDEVDWHIAHSDAGAIGGYLTAINTAQEEIWIDSALGESGIDKIWIGLSDSETYCGMESEINGGTSGNHTTAPHWIWTSGEEIGYTNWSVNEPNNANGGEDFGVFDRTLSNGFWKDVQATIPHRYLIEMPLAVDNCESLVIISQSPIAGTVISEVNMDSLGGWTRDVTIFADDGNGNISSCITTLITTDITPPTAICSDVTISVDSSGQAILPVSSINNGSFDNCGIEQITLSQTVFTGADVNNSPISISMFVIDVNGNQDECTAFVTVENNEDLVINCVPDVTIGLDNDCTIFLGDYAPQAMIENGFGEDVTITQDPAPGTEISSEQIVPITLTAIDELANMAECQFVVTTRDTIAPVVNCQNITILLGSTGGISISPIFIDNGSSDNCGILSMTVVPDTFGCENIGVNDVTLTITDVNGNSSSCQASVTVNDLVAPEITACADDAVIYLDENCVSILPDFTGSILFTDNCLNDVTVLQIPEAGSVYNTSQSFIVTISAVDASGNFDDCIINVEVQDTIKPIVLCQDITIDLNAAGTAAVSPAIVSVSAEDNCGIDTMQLFPNTFTCTEIGLNDVTLTVTDLSGNIASCFATVYVRDVESPVIVNCPVNDQIDLDQNCEVLLPDYTETIEYNDNCVSDVTITQSPQPGTQYFSQQIVIVTLSIFDAGGNLSDCTINVEIRDTIPPLAICQDITVFLDENTMDVTISADQIDAGSSDNCGIDSLSVFPSSFSQVDIGQVNVTLSATDLSGNTSTCEAIVTVKSAAETSLTCQDVTLFLDVDGNVTAQPADVCLGEGGFCQMPGLVLSLSEDQFSCVDLGPNNVTLTAVDIEENEFSCDAILTVQDTFPPIIFDCPLDVTLNALPEDCSGDHLWLKPLIYSDNCTDIITLALSLDVAAFDKNGNEFPVSSQLFTAFANFPVGLNTVIYSVTDESGNIGTCSFTVKMLDITDPVLDNCPSSGSVSLTYQPGECGAIADWIPPTCNDECGCIDLLTNYQPGSFFPVGTTTVTYQGQDSSGNLSAICSFDVVVVDTTDQSITCEISEISSELDTLCKNLIPDLSDQITINGLCADVTITQDISAGTEIFDSTWVIVTVLDQNSNESQCEILVIVPDALSVSFSTNGVTCFGDSDGTATAVPDNGTPPYTYNWDVNTGNQTAPTAIGLSQGIYDVTVTDANNCATTGTATITQPSDITLEVNTMDVACSGMSDGSASVAVSGGVLPYTFLWDADTGSQTDSIASNLMVGIYDVTITDGNGCTLTTSAEIGETVQLEIDLETNDVTCNGDETGSATAIVTGGTGPYDFNWSSNIGSLSTESGLVAGEYSLTVTDVNGCEVEVLFTIHEPSAIIADVTINDVSCNGASDGSVIISVSGGIGPYSIGSTSGVFNDSVITGLSAGIHDITILDSAACEKILQIEILEPALLLAGVQVLNDVVCNGDANGSAVALASGGSGDYQFLWSNGSTDSTTTGFAAGVHSLMLFDAKGCTADVTFEISEPDDITLEAVTDIDASCEGFSDGVISALVSGGVGGYSYTWHDAQGNTVSDTSMLIAGLYYVTVTDVNGCEAFDSTEVFSPSLLEVQGIPIDAKCDGRFDGIIDITVSGGTPQYSFLWSDDVTLEDRIELTAGTYDVTVTDQKGCTTTASWVVNAPSQIVLNSTQTEVSCFGGDDGSVTVLASGGTEPYSYSANAGSIEVNTISGLSAGLLDITVTDAQGCESYINIEIFESPELIASIIVDSPISCFGDSNAALAAVVSGGTYPYGYAWSNGGTDSTTTGYGAGIHSLTVTDIRGCVEDITFELAEPDDITLLVSNIQDASCAGGSDGSVSAVASGGVGGFVYHWEDASQNIVDPEMLIAGTYYVTVIDANGCAENDSVVVSEPPVLVVEGTTIDASCYLGTDGIINIESSGGTPGYSFIWNDDVTLEDRDNLAAGTYDVTVTDAKGCLVYESWVIGSPDDLTLTTEAEEPSCLGESDGVASVNVLGGTPTYLYEWSNGGTTPLIENLTSGIYDVTVTDMNGCQKTTSIEVIDPDDITITLIEVNDVLCFGTNTGSIDIDVIGGTPGYAYIWSSGDTIQDPIDLSAGIYDVTVTDSRGCQSFFSREIFEPTAVQVESIQATNVTCHSGNDGAINIEIIGGTSPYNFIWSDQQIIEDRIELFAGVYDVTITDDNGCQVSTSITIFEPTALIVDITTESASCNGETDGSATAITTGGTEPYSYQWDGNANNQMTQTAINLSAGVYDVTITDSKGCTISTSAAVTGPSDLITFSSHTDVSCNSGSDGTATANISGGTAPYTFSWDNGTIVTDVTVSSIDNLIAGTYGVEITDANGCVAVSFEVVGEPTPIQFSATTINEVCIDDSTGSIDLMVLGGTGDYTYLWSNGQTSQDLTGLPAGPYDVTITDDNDCKKYAGWIINSVDDEKPQIFCPEGQIYSCLSDIPAPNLDDLTVSDNCQVADVTILEETSNNGSGCMIDPLLITRVFKVTDLAGNTQTCEQILTVRDTTAPTFSVPVDTVVFMTSNCSYEASPSMTGSATEQFDNCGNSLTLTYNDVTLSGVCEGEVTIIRSWSLTDECQNTTTREQTITVIDTIAPIFTVPGDITINSQSACSFNADTAITGDVLDESDNCSTDIQATFEDTSVPGACEGELIITRTWHLVDACGNIAIDRQQTIVVRDMSPPSFTSPQDVTIATDANCNYDASPIFTGNVLDESDNCSSGLVATYEDLTIEGVCEGEILITRTWSLIDACGNSAEDRTQIILVRDTIAPEFTVPADITISIGPDCSVVSNTSSTGDVDDETDNCSSILEATYMDITMEGGCQGEVIISRTWSLTDDCGNQAQDQIQTIIARDTVPPTFSAPVDITIAKSQECSYNASTAMTGAPIDISDNCSSGFLPTFDDITLSGECDGDLIIIRSWNLSDDCGNQAETKQQTIIVRDITPPSFDVPNDITIQGNSSCGYDADPVNTGSTINESDNCSLELQSFFDDVTVAGECQGELDILRSWYMKDGCGNQSESKTQLITIRDMTVPTFTAPADATIAVGFNCDYNSSVLETGDVQDELDNCSTGLVATYSDVTFNGICDGEVIIQRTWKLQDYCGNKAADQIQTITARDTIIPAFTAPGDITISLDLNCNYDVSTSLTGEVNDATDNCSSNLQVTYADVTMAGSCPGEIIISRTWSLEDACGNRAVDQQQEIRVQDVTVPSGIIPNDTTYQCFSEVPSQALAESMAIAEDNCVGDVTIEVSDDIDSGSGCFGDPAFITRTFTLTDCKGLQNVLIQLITVEDQTPPMATIPPDLTFECINDVPPLASVSLLGVTDNCGGDVTVEKSEVDDSATGCFHDPLIITRTFTLTDCGGLSTLITQMIKVEDTVGPTGTAPSDTIYECAMDVPPGNVDLVINEVDNCGGEVIVMVSDLDNGGGGCLSDPLIITRTYSLMDCGGLQTDLVQTITVIDTTGPVLTGDTDILFEVSCTENIDSILFSAQVLANDDCSGELVSLNILSDEVTSGNCAGNYSRKITYEILDLCGNAGEQMFTVTVNVFDTIAPVGLQAVGSADVTLNCDDQLGILGALIYKPEFSDDCSPAEETMQGVLVSQSVTLDNSCPNGYTHVRFFVATDECGNASEQFMQTIVIVDETAPEINCPADITIKCDESTSTSNTGTATAMDNCSVKSKITITHNDVVTPGSCPNEMVIERTWTAFDECENSANCLQIITVVDQDAPTFACPADLTLEMDESVPDPEMIIAIDNCNGEIPVSASDEILVGNFVDTLNRTYAAIDECGNEFSCIQTILVPVDITMACPDDIDIPVNDRNCVNAELQALPVASLISRLTFGAINVDIAGYADGGLPTDLVVFDSENPIYDPDLGTPNVMFGGPGVSSDHPEGKNSLNNQSWGKIMVISQDGTANDHAQGDSIVFDFSEPVFLEGVTLIDVKDPTAKVVLYEHGNSTPDTISLSSHMSNDLLEVSFYRYGVIKMSILLGSNGGSGAVAQLCFNDIPEFILEPDITFVSEGDVTVENNGCSVIVTRPLIVNEAGDDVTCEQIISYAVDYERPQTFCPNSIILNCGQPVSPPTPDSVSAVDNCTDSSNLVFQHIEDIVTGLGCEIQILRIYGVTDASGNESLCAQTIEYENAPTPPIRIVPSVLLHGVTIDSTSMSNSIFDELPLLHPYGAETYEYAPLDSVPAMPEDVIDWVLVELRSAADTAQNMIARTSGLLRENGTIIGIDGSLGVEFEGVAPGLYYIVLRHRNHIDIMSDVPVLCSEGASYYDFTTGGTFGTNAQFEFQPGRFAMWPGDYNFDGVIDAGDRSIAWNMRNQIGYLYEDVNMDGVVDASERSIAWNNRNKASFVPQE